MPLKALGPAAVLLALTATPALAADVEVRAIALNRYDTTDVLLATGDRLVLANTAVFSQHNLTAVIEDAAGTPLFASPTLEPGEVAAVVGSDELSPGKYEFFCTIYPTTMRGRAMVTGTPDTRAPALSATVEPRTTARVLRSGRMPVAVEIDESGSAALTARAKGRIVARGAASLRAGTTRTGLELTEIGRRLLRRDGPLAVTVTVRAIDRAGNAAEAMATRTFRR